MRYASYSCICVYMNITKDLPEDLDLRWEYEDRFQPLDYEHIPFRCRRCHEHGHLYRDCPENNPSNSQKVKEMKYAEGFTKVTRRKRKTKCNQGPEVNKKTSSSNPFDALQ